VYLIQGGPRPHCAASHPLPRKLTMSLQDPNVLNPQRRKRVALVIANPAVSTTTGWPVGFW